ncbi:hypothetical protein GGS24DRAFT_509447 [Hypoxylon argillaceum]|nr:hypothetical protein GGS24DRAFT_509447 [Hypoxylon argillaceum]
MPSAKSRAQARIGRQMPVDFRFLMMQMERQLKAQGNGRDQIFCQELKKKFTEAVKKTSPQPKNNPFDQFVWKLFHAVSNRFWPGSVRRNDMPLQIRRRKGPFIDACAFKALDIDAISLAQLVDFIQDNGQTSFHWPRKLELPKKPEIKREASQPRGDESSHITIPPLPKPSLPSKPTQSTPWTPTPPFPTKAKLSCTNVSLLASSVQDDHVRTIQVPQSEVACTAFFTKVQVPTLSFVCRPHWNLNNKERWTPVAGFNYEACFPSDELFKPQPSDTVQLDILGPVSFTRPSEKDREAFLSKFLGYT